MVMCYEPSFNLGASDTIVFYTALATVYNGTVADIGTAMTNAETFMSVVIVPPPCCENGCDFNGDFFVDISDLVAMVAYMFQGGPAPVCPQSGDSNGDGEVDIADLVRCVDYMFKGGLTPPPCSPPDPWW